jgi:hypothetical protein
MSNSIQTTKAGERTQPKKSFRITKEDMKPDPEYAKAILQGGGETLVRFKKEEGKTFLWITNGWYPLQGNGYGSLSAGPVSFKRVYLP